MIGKLNDWIFKINFNLILPGSEQTKNNSNGLNDEDAYMQPVHAEIVHILPLLYHKSWA